jgi:cysteinyl-tRNA synthetase
MPEPLYVQQKGEDGTINYVEVTEIPEEIVKTHPEYNRVAKLKDEAVEESKKRLQRAQAAEEKLKKEPTTQQDPEPKQEAPTPTPTPTIDEDTLFEKVYAKVKADLAKDNEAINQKKAAIKNLINKHRLHGIDGIEDILSEASNMETLAEKLGRAAVKFEAFEGGAAAEVEQGDFMDAVYKNLNLPK